MYDEHACNHLHDIDQFVVLVYFPQRNKSYALEFCVDKAISVGKITHGEPHVML